MSTCDKCKYFYTNDKNSACRRFPPQTHFIVVLRAVSRLTPGQLEPKEEQRSAFPPVMPDWTCGEWAPRIELTS